MIDQTGLMASSRGGGLSIHPTAIDQQCVGWVRIVNPPSNNAEMVKRRMLDHTELMASTRDVVLSSHPTAVRIALRADEAIAWLLSDHLGSTSVTVDPSGNLMSALKYTAYGELRTGTSTTDYQYTGQRNEAEIGLYFYVARFYDPQLARFISADTIVPEPNSIKGYDRYAYVNGNPVNYTDPSGHRLCDTADGSCTGGGGGNGIEHPEPQVIYWGGLSETELVEEYQQFQGDGPFCASFAIATGLSMLYESNISGRDVLDAFPHGFLVAGLSVLPNGGAVIPSKQAIIVNKYSSALINRTNDLPIAVNIDLDIDQLKQSISDPNQVVLFTYNTKAGVWFSGHTIVLSAYKSNKGFGFLNSGYDRDPEFLTWYTENQMNNYMADPIGMWNSNFVVISKP
jgi:RHS repeat-associated protein